MVTKSRINTLCYDAKNSMLFSGNSEGSIMSWHVNTGTWYMYMFIVDILHVQKMYLYMNIYNFITWSFPL